MRLHWGAMWTRCPLDSSRPIVMLSGPRDLWVRLGYPHSARLRLSTEKMRWQVSVVLWAVLSSLLKKVHCWRRFVVEESSLWMKFHWWFLWLLSCTPYSNVFQLNIIKISILFYYLLSNIYTRCPKSTGISRYLCSHSNKYVNKIFKAKFWNHFRCK